MSRPIYVLTATHRVFLATEMPRGERIKLWCHEGGEWVRSPAPTAPAARSRPPCSPSEALKRKEEDHAQMA